MLKSQGGPPIVDIQKQNKTRPTQEGPPHMQPVLVNSSLNYVQTDATTLQFRVQAGRASSRMSDDDI